MIFRYVPYNKVVFSHKASLFPFFPALPYLLAAGFFIVDTITRYPYRYNHVWFTPSKDYYKGRAMADDYNRRETDRLYGQNKDQYQKIHDNSQAIAALRSELEGIKVDLIGVTGQNGLRGEFRTYKIESEKRDTAVLKALEEMKHKQENNLKWTVGLLVGVPGVVAAIMRFSGG